MQRRLFYILHGIKLMLNKKYLCWLSVDDTCWYHWHVAVGSIHAEVLCRHWKSRADWEVS